MAWTLVVAGPAEDYSETHAHLRFLWRFQREGVHRHRRFRWCGVRKTRGRTNGRRHRQRAWVLSAVAQADPRRSRIARQRYVSANKRQDVRDRGRFPRFEDRAEAAHEPGRLSRGADRRRANADLSMRNGYVQRSARRYGEVAGVSRRFVESGTHHPANRAKCEGGSLTDFVRGRSGGSLDDPCGKNTVTVVPSPARLSIAK